MKWRDSDVREPFGANCKAEAGRRRRCSSAGGREPGAEEAVACGIGFLPSRRILACHARRVTCAMELRGPILSVYRPSPRVSGPITVERIDFTPPLQRSKGEGRRMLLSTRARPCLPLRRLISRCSASATEITAYKEAFARRMAMAGIKPHHRIGNTSSLSSHFFHF